MYVINEFVIFVNFKFVCVNDLLWDNILVIIQGKIVKFFMKVSVKYYIDSGVYYIVCMIQ